MAREALERAEQERWLAYAHAATLMQSLYRGFACRRILATIRASMRSAVRSEVHTLVCGSLLLHVDAGYTLEMALRAEREAVETAFRE